MPALPNLAEAANNADRANALTAVALWMEDEAVGFSTDVSPAGFLHNAHSSPGTETGEPNASFFAPLFESTDCALIFSAPIDIRRKRITERMRK